jgi:hypothetical protein
MSGRFIERHTLTLVKLKRARAINAEASDDAASIVCANIDGWGPLEPASTYWVLIRRDLI